jgi:glycerol-3-phosphate cytidylyltransferase
MCDVLIVGICDGNYVRDIKHKEPVISETDRCRIVKALKCVDDAVIVDFKSTDDKMLAYEKFKFDVLFSGDDWKGSERYLRTEEQFKPLGVSIEYLPYTKGVSTSELKSKIR